MSTAVGSLSVAADARTVRLERRGVSLKLAIGCSVEENCEELTTIRNTLTARYSKGTEMRVTFSALDNSLERYDIEWSNPNNYHYMKDIVDTVSGGHWYGGPQLAQQQWPIARDSNGFAPYVSGDVLKNFGTTSGDPMSGMERYWLCSNKFAIQVEDEVPLWTEHMSGRLSLQAQIRDSPYKTDINQSLVLAFSNEITANKADISQLELDDDWATNYGDFEFNEAKFPDVPKMCAALREKNVRLTLWVHPFVNLDSANGKDPAVLELCVKNGSGVPGVTKWWHSDAYVIDFTNPRASRWFEEQLGALQKLGVYSFKFDGGEVTYLPPDFRLFFGKSPNDYVKAYIELASHFGDAIEARVFSHCQNLPIFFRTLDRQSTWDSTGFDSILPVALNFSLLGYNFNMPDMIGGNGYSLGVCSKELFARWMQANLFLLTMQFSYTPWDFDVETCSVFHELMEIRRKNLSYLMEAVEKCCRTGEPAICPMWWLSDAEEALACGDQFVVNDSLIVAPVVKPGQVKRSVFLPEGIWEDAFSCAKYSGPSTIEVDAPLHGCVPYFIRVCK